jgi:hypothetical protein
MERVPQEIKFERCERSTDRWTLRRAASPVDSRRFFDAASAQAASNGPFGPAGFATETDQCCGARNRHGRVAVIAVAQIERNGARTPASGTAAIFVQGSSPGERIHEAGRLTGSGHRDRLRAKLLVAAKPFEKRRSPILPRKR